MRNLDTTVVACLLVVIFSTNQIARKAVLTHFPPLLSGTLIYGLGVIVLWIYVLIRNIDWQPKSWRLWQLYGVSAFLFALTNGVGLIALQFTLASRASILLLSYPLFVTIYEQFRPNSSPWTIQKTLGFLTIVLGLGMMFLDQSSSNTKAEVYWIGDGLSVLSSAILGYMTLHVQYTTQKSSATKVVLWQTTIGLPFFILTALIFESMPDWPSTPESIYGILYHALIINAFGFIIRAWLIARNGASTVTLFFLLSPFIAVILSYLLLNEPIKINIIISGIVFSLGIWLIYPRSHHHDATKK